jgi:sensor domain CHASE-containing protein
LEKLRLQHLRQIRAASGATVALIKPLPADQAALSLQAAQTQAVKALAMPEREPVTVAAAWRRTLTIKMKPATFWLKMW